MGSSPEDAVPGGQDILTLTFDIADIGGQFEFDTACFSSVIKAISMIDGEFPPVDHGSGASGTGEVVFTKGVVTVLSDPGGILDGESAVPELFTLNQNYPNPFNDGTAISFSLSTAADVRLAVYDILGRRVAVIADGFHTAGSHRAGWDGTDRSGEAAASGIYFAVLHSPEGSLQKKMLLLR